MIHFAKLLQLIRGQARVSDSPSQRALVLTEDDEQERFTKPDEYYRHNYYLSPNPHWLGYYKVVSGYPRGLCSPPPIKAQISFLAKTLGLSPDSALNFAERLRLYARSDGAEGWWAIPSIHGLARRHFPEVLDTKERFRRATGVVLEKLREKFSFVQDKRLGDGTINLEQVPERTKAIELIAEEQGGGDILLIQAQFGLLHASISPEEARKRFEKNEFELGLLEAGSMLLVHPGRVAQEEYDFVPLYLCCTGDRVQDCCYMGGETPSHWGETYPYFSGSDLYLEGWGTKDSGAVIGSITGFVPRMYADPEGVNLWPGLEGAVGLETNKFQIIGDIPSEGKELQVMNVLIDPNNPDCLVEAVKEGLKPPNDGEALRRWISGGNAMIDRMMYGD